MALYIKANRKVAEYLSLTELRNKMKDGNYLLWQADMLAFGPLTELENTLKAIGAIALQPYEARQEQDGTVTRPLPTATDERFIIYDKVDDTQMGGAEIVSKWKESAEKKKAIEAEEQEASAEDNNEKKE